MKIGIAGRLASAFINSKLTPLIIITALLLGVFATLKTPREEDPQIVVPMMDILVSMPGASAKEVERRVSIPMEKLIWEIPGIEYVYSTSSPGQSLVVAQFYVGWNEDEALVRLREKLQSHYDIIPPGASLPIIKPRSINDVPILALTLHSKDYNAYQLRLLAERVEDEIKPVYDVSETHIIGGDRREVRVTLDREKMAGYNLGPEEVAQALGGANQSAVAGYFSHDNTELAINTGTFLKNIEDVGSIVVGVFQGHPVYLSDIARIQDGPEEPKDYVFLGYGKGSGKPVNARGLQPAVTISVAKRKGSNAVNVVSAVMQKVNGLKGTLIPSDVYITVTRNYGATAEEKSNDLLFHMLIAVISVTLLIAITLGWKESMVVLIAIPVTLALTLLVFYLYGYTLNRITLFALIFSIGILVDDAIVVVENIVRHSRLPLEQRKPPMESAIYAVDEVGNPTILATFTVISAILPMAFVSGMMGPYMRPIPVGASAAMLFSLMVAFVVTPYAAFKLLKEGHPHKHSKHAEGEKDMLLVRIYKKVMRPMLRSWKLRLTYFITVVLLLVGSILLVATKLVVVKMLPFDNKSEFQIIIDMPMGTTLEQTAAATRAMANFIATVPEVHDYEMYVGTASPYNFNGLVRHYYMRQWPYQADIQVNLVGKSKRSTQSHDIVKRIRPEIARIAKQWGIRVKVAEVPPGPPVLETLVAEVFGPTQKDRLDIAKKIKHIFNTTDGVCDVDWYVDDNQPTYRFIVDKQKAALNGVDTANVNATLALALSGQDVGLAHDATAREDIPIKLRISRAERSGFLQLEQLYVAARDGHLVPLQGLVKPVRVDTDKSLYRKNLHAVVYVTGDVTGRLESPVYAILNMDKRIDLLRGEYGHKVDVMFTHIPSTTNQVKMKWSGEWQITYEVFRDLGIAFAAVLVLIYILVVGWFQSYKTPFIIMTPIALTLIGVLPGHWILGAYFTATSMIGFIAGGGIIVRNSILLVDFIELRLEEGIPLEQAVIDAGALRFRPILLTAAAVIVGSFVILFDPIFQGMAISLMAGAIASTILSQMAVPILYFLMKSSELKKQEKEMKKLNKEESA